MAKTTHEFRDAIHSFITCSTDERKVINSRPMQRLRHIHHLAMTYLLYPGATHRRFEHSLGVMHLATRMFDTLTDPENLRHLDSNVRSLIDEHIGSDRQKNHWKTVVRMGALCHDVGHLPFSHGAEELLPEGISHETLTRKIITGPHMAELWRSLSISEPEEIAKVAVGAKEASRMNPPKILSPWEDLMAEIVVGNAFGADRMDYLLRDSLHTGVAYGKFDVDRLIKTLRFLPQPPEGEGGESDNPVIGVELGGLHAAESMLWARYFMFSQVYFHPVRKIYDLHLQEFMKAEFSRGIPLDDGLEQFLKLTDNEVLASLRKAAYDPLSPGHDPARRIEKREHFKKFFELTFSERQSNPLALQEVAEAARTKWGKENIRVFDKDKSAGTVQFPVRRDDGKSIPAQAQSPAIKNLPVVTTGYIFINPQSHMEARKWIAENRGSLVKDLNQGEAS